MHPSLFELAGGLLKKLGTVSEPAYERRPTCTEMFRNYVHRSSGFTGTRWHVEDDFARGFGKESLHATCSAELVIEQAVARLYFQAACPYYRRRPLIIDDPEKRENCRLVGGNPDGMSKLAVERSVHWQS
jgi:hypothetical protein